MGAEKPEPDAAQPSRSSRPRELTPIQELNKLDRSLRGLHRGRYPKEEGEPKQRIRNALTEFEKAAGGREAIVEALVHSPIELSAQQQLLLGALADPANDPRSLAMLTGDCGVSIKDLLELVSKAQGAKALIESMREVWAGLPPVVKDLMERSAPHQQDCSDCRGSGKVKVKNPDWTVGSELPRRIEEECERCQGSGKLQVLPDLERQKLALEIGGVYSRQPGVQVNVQNKQQFGVFAPGDLVRFQSESDREIYGAERQLERDERAAGERVQEIVDAETVPAEESGAEDAEEDY